MSLSVTNLPASVAKLFHHALLVRKVVHLLRQHLKFYFAYYNF